MSAIYLSEDELGGACYETYSKAVGGKAFNGDPLPSWEEMKDDKKKRNLVSAWKEAAVAAVSANSAAAPKPPKLPSRKSLTSGVVPGTVPPATKRLEKRTQCCGANVVRITKGGYTCSCKDLFIPF